MKDRNWNANNSMAVSLHTLYSQTTLVFLSPIPFYSWVEFNIFYSMKKTILGILNLKVIFYESEIYFSHIQLNCPQFQFMTPLSHSFALSFAKKLVSTFTVTYLVLLEGCYRSPPLQNLCFSGLDKHSSISLSSVLQPLTSLVVFHSSLSTKKDFFSTEY